MRQQKGFSFLCLYVLPAQAPPPRSDKFAGVSHGMNCREPDFFTQPIVVVAVHDSSMHNPRPLVAFHKIRPIDLITRGAYERRHLEERMVLEADKFFTRKGGTGARVFGEYPAFH